MSAAGVGEITIPKLCDTRQQGDIAGTGVVKRAAADGQRAGAEGGIGGTAAAVIDVQLLASRKGGAAGIGVRTAKRQCAGSSFHNATGSADDTIQRQTRGSRQTDRRSSRRQCDGGAHRVAAQRVRNQRRAIAIIKQQ